MHGSEAVTVTSTKRFSGCRGSALENETKPRKPPFHGIRRGQVRKVCFSPEGAKVNSPGRQPWGCLAKRSAEPRRGGSNVGFGVSAAPSGLAQNVELPVVPGLTPWAIDCRPFGAVRQQARCLLLLIVDTNHAENRLVLDSRSASGKLPGLTRPGPAGRSRWAWRPFGAFRSNYGAFRSNYNATIMVTLRQRLRDNRVENT